MRNIIVEDSFDQAPAAPLDVTKLRERLQEDAALLCELAQLFLSDAPKQIEQIRTTISRSDAKGLEMSAHALKGAAVVFVALPFAEAARKLEYRGRSGMLVTVREDFESLQKEWARLKPELERLCAAVQTT